MMKREMKIRDLPKPLQYAAVGVLLLGSGLAGPAAAHDGHDLLVPTPGCIQTILNTDNSVPADDYLAGTATFDTREGASHDGVTTWSPRWKPNGNG